MLINVIKYCIYHIFFVYLHANMKGETIMKTFRLLIIALTIVGCANTSTKSASQETSGSAQVITIETDELKAWSPATIGEIPVPDGFDRVPIKDTASFAYFLRTLPLKPLGTPVYDYAGCEAWTSSYAYAVIDAYAPSNEDLQQCADAIIRLRAEWLYKFKRYDEIAFHFTNGWLCDYRHWADGYRVSVNGNKTSWYKGAEPDYSYETFRKYLDMVFMYAGTLSLSKELTKTPIHEIKAGDVFIKGGTPGHAIIVVDVASKIAGDHKGERCFIVAESYMPAQDIHILKNLNIQCESISPWYNAMDVYRNGEDYNFASFSFWINNLKQFKF